MPSTLSEAKIRELLQEEIASHKREGIKFAIAGNSGYGKTSTVNTLFHVNMKTDAVSPATIRVHEISMSVQNAHFAPTDTRDTALTVFDLPGLADGENQNKFSEEYFEIYLKLLPQVDVILWTLRADVRTYQLDVDYISKLVKADSSLKSRIIIGVNFIDSISPQNWNKAINQPSPEQESNIAEVVQRVSRLIHRQCGLKSDITIPYSSKQAWGLETLFSALMGATPEGKRWVFADLKPDYRDAFLSRIPEKFRNQVAQYYGQ